MFKIIGEVNEIIDSYSNHSIQIMDGLNFSQSQIIKMIEFYSSSKYLGGQLDELGKEKPFYNIGNAICDVENAAVDLDTKDIIVTADEPQDFDKSFLMSKEIYEWMKEANFAKTLNDLRDTRTRYGGVLAKKCIEVDEDGTRHLEIEVPEWKNLTVDPIDIENGVIIEKHYMSPAKLAKKSDVWDNVEEAMKLATKERQTNGFTSKQATNKKIPVYEVRGEFPMAFYKEADGGKVTEKDKYKFSYQLYIIAGEQSGKQVILYKENDTEKVYKYLARKKKAGRALGVGVIEEGEQAQVWTNDSVQKQQRALEYSSKVVGQSASKKLKGRNVLTEVDNGTILETEDNKPITTVNLVPSGGMAQFENMITQWNTQLERTTSSYAAQRGETPPSGTPFRLQAQVLNQSSSVFEDLREEFGIWIAEMFYDWIFPYLGSRLNKAHILGHEFSADELKALDKAYSLHSANEYVINQILQGQLVTQMEYEQAQQMAIEAVQKTKAHRFMDIPKNYYKDLKSKITIITTGEQRNKSATLESLTNIMTIISTNPAVLQDPVLSQIFNKIMELSGAGISPLSLATGQQTQIQNPQAAQQQAPQAPQQMSLAANPQ